MDIIDALIDLNKQATTERSHFYVEKVTREAAQEILRLRTCLKECADDLESMIEAQYAGMEKYPDQQRRKNRDLKPVLAACALLKDA